MNIDDLTLGQIKHIKGLCSGESPSHPYEVGRNYFIRTVTMIQVGKLVDVTPQELVLEEAAWIADTGRFNEALKSGTFSEVEPFPDGKVIIGRGAIIDACRFDHATQRIVK